MRDTREQLEAYEKELDERASKVEEDEKVLADKWAVLHNKQVACEHKSKSHRISSFQYGNFATAHARPTSASPRRPRMPTFEEDSAQHDLEVCQVSIEEIFPDRKSDSNDNEVDFRSLHMLETNTFNSVAFLDKCRWRGIVER